MTYERAVNAVVNIEGGYVCDPRDPGGETKFGICKRSYPDLDIKNLSLQQALAILKADFWYPARCDQLPHPLSCLVFDAAVNQGVGVAVRLLQKSLDTPQDGILGQNTLAAVKRADQHSLCALYLADRALRYTGTRNFDLYGRGWFKRLFVLAMASER